VQLQVVRAARGKAFGVLHRKVYRSRGTSAGKNASQPRLVGVSGFPFAVTSVVTSANRRVSSSVIFYPILPLRLAPLAEKSRFFAG
jgi:hypothetical protein